MGIRKCWIEPDGLIVILAGTLVIALAQVSVAPVGVRRGVFRSYPDGFVAIGNGAVMVAFAVRGPAAIVIGSDVLRIEPDGPAAIGDGPVIVPFGQISISAVVVCGQLSKAAGLPLDNERAGPDFQIHVLSLKAAVACVRKRPRRGGQQQRKPREKCTHGGFPDYFNKGIWKASGRQRGDAAANLLRRSVRRLEIEVLVRDAAVDEGAVPGASVERDTAVAGGYPTVKSAYSRIMVNAGMVNARISYFSPATFCESFPVFGRFLRFQKPFKYNCKFRANQTAKLNLPFTNHMPERTETISIR